MTIDDYIDRRNEIQLHFEPGNPGNPHEGRLPAEKFANEVFAELGVANRHIARVLDGVLPLSAVAREIEQCFERVEKKYGLRAQ
jgi:hypothetical protein